MAWPYVKTRQAEHAGLKAGAREAALNIRFCKHLDSFWVLSFHGYIVLFTKCRSSSDVNA